MPIKYQNITRCPFSMFTIKSNLYSNSFKFLLHWIKNNISIYDEICLGQILLEISSVQPAEFCDISESGEISPSSVNKISSSSELHFYRTICGTVRLPSTDLYLPKIHRYSLNISNSLWNELTYLFRSFYFSPLLFFSKSCICLQINFPKYKKRSLDLK